MKQTSLYLVRHAETVANKNQILQGQSNDHPLTEDGERQAESLGRLLRGRRWRRLYSSDLPRAITTAERALRTAEHSFDELSISPTHQLREMCFGLREGHHRETTSEEARRLKATELGIALHEVVDPIETEEELLQRQHNFIKHIIQDLLREEQELDAEASNNVFCMAHGGYILRFLRNICGVKDMGKIKNCAVSIVDLHFDEEGNYHLSPRIGALNMGVDVTHIP